MYVVMMPAPANINGHAAKSKTPIARHKKYKVMPKIFGLTYTEFEAF